MANIGKHSIMTFAGNLGAPAIALATAPLLAQSLGLHDRGIVAGATVPTILAISIASAGIPEAITRFVARSWHNRRKITFQAVIMSAITAVIGIGLVVAASDLLSGGDSQMAYLMSVAASSIAPQLGLGIVRARAAANSLWRRIAIERAIAAAMRLAIIIILIISNEINALSAVIAITMSPIIGIFAYIGKWPATNPERAGDSDSRHSTAEMLTFTGSYWVGAAAGILVLRLDQVLLSALSTPANLGVYAVAVTVSEVPLLVNAAIRDVTFAAEAQGSSTARLAAATRASNAAVMAAGVAISVAAIPLVPLLFGAEFSDAVPLVAMLSGAVILGNPASVIGMGFVARGKPALRSAILVASLAAAIVANLILVPHMGAFGASLATILASAVLCVSTVVVAQRVLGVRAREILVPTRADIDILVRSIQHRR